MQYLLQSCLFFYITIITKALLLQEGYMKVEIDENIEYTEEIARLQCRYKTTRIRKLAYMIQQFGMQIEVSKEEKTIQVDVDDILYAETVDRKTFLYSDNEIYYYKGTLTKLEEELKVTSFLRISKTTLLNVRYLNYVKPYVNHRLKATLTNGEYLII